jgi:tRNA-dihydrouridine synthase B
MIGRGAHGRPWIFREIEHYLAYGTDFPAPGLAEVRGIVLGHLAAMYALYGDELGARIARKHVGWYARSLPGGEALRRASNCASNGPAQLAAAQAFFDALPDPQRAQPALKLAA